jgi:hypothetical protein
MVSIVPADTGLFANVIPKAVEEFIKTNQKEESVKKSGVLPGQQTI